MIGGSPKEKERLASTRGSVKVGKGIGCTGVRMAGAREVVETKL